MRPTLIDPIYAPVSSLAGVGPRITKLMAKLLGVAEPGEEPVVWALLKHIPNAVIDRRMRCEVALAPSGSVVTLEVTVDRHEPAPRRARQPYRVFAFDGTGEIALVFFRADQKYLERMLSSGEVRLLSGKVEWFNGRPQMVHPDYIVALDKVDELPAVEPVYGLTDGLTLKTVRKAIEGAIDRVPDMPEWISEDLIERHHFPSFSTALQALHHPNEPDIIEPQSLARQRLAYDELLANQLAIALVRARYARKAGKVRQGTGAITKKILTVLPFEPTPAQSQAIRDIAADMARPNAMLRLLQGDVGAGKTLVALLAMTMAVEAGDQAALMAPTDLLARQHAESLAPLCDAAGLRLLLLTGKDKEARKAELRRQIAEGNADLVLGTHALFQESVSFKSLGLVVVDEQHRFGVHQRLALAARGDQPDMLVMTATPIPRTLVLSIYGDMDVSALREKPKGRQPIETRTVSLNRLDELVERIGEAISRGEKAYWVCPLVEASEKLEITSAEERFEILESLFPGRVACVHGRMSGDQKEAAMARFKAGEVQILVATTVIEVGVDVPDATIIVIEHAERFGLAQLHQLRGRVGRGAAKSSCLLLYKAPLGDTAKARLTALRDSQDGFYLAEEDLRLRGEGDLLGTRQSGLPTLAFADLDHHGDLLEIARDDARYITNKDPTLESKRGDALRILLYLYGRDQAVRTIKAG